MVKRFEERNCGGEFSGRAKVFHGQTSTEDSPAWFHRCQPSVALLSETGSLCPLLKLLTHGVEFAVSEGLLERFLRYQK